MRVYINFFVLLALLLLTFSCRMPLTKTDTQLIKYLERNKFNKENQFGLTGKGYTQRFSSSNRYLYTLDLYDDKGRLFIPSDSLTRTCWGPMMDVYENLSDTSLFEIVMDNDLKNDSTLLNELVLLNGEKASFPNYKEYDYTLVLYWSWWSMKSKIKQILGFEKMVIENNPEFRIKVIKINMDFRDYMENEGYDNHESNKRIIENHKNKKSP